VSDTFQQVATQAYIKNGMLAPGEALDANLAAYALSEANDILDSWNVQLLFISSYDIALYTLTARTLPNYFYTIGPAGGTLDTDFHALQPTRIIRANLMLTQSNPNSRVPLQILDIRQWSDETVPALGTTVPTSLYYDYANVPNGVDTDGNSLQYSRMYVWPYPTSTLNQMELFTPKQLARFTDVQNTFSMPVGYRRALVLTLAESTAEGVREISATLRADGARARAAIRGLNSQSPKMSTVDSGMPGQRRNGGNFYNGWPTQIN
jgi:hypothetical protein